MIGCLLGVVRGSAVCVVCSIQALLENSRSNLGFVIGKEKQDRGRDAARDSEWGLSLCQVPGPHRLPPAAPPARRTRLFASVVC